MEIIGAVIIAMGLGWAVLAITWRSWDRWDR